MTEHTYERARIIKAQIMHIETILNEDHLFRHGYECDPPLRNTSWKLVGGNVTAIDLNEGEVVCIRDALASYKTTLEAEFGRL